jgi:hypothetical protein
MVLFADEDFGFWRRKADMEHHTKLEYAKFGHTTLGWLRIATGGALVGSVLTGVFFGHLPLSFDPRALGALAGVIVYLMLYH